MMASDAQSPENATRRLAPENAPGLPAVLQIDAFSWSDAESDARHIAQLASAALDCHDDSERRSALLWVIRDLAELLSWKCENAGSKRGAEK